MSVNTRGEGVVFASHDIPCNGFATRFSKTCEQKLDSGALDHS